MKFERLFTPITINGMTLKNRIVMPAMDTLFTPDGFINDRFNYFYWKRAEGGAGLIVVGGAVIDEYGSAYAMIHISDDKFIAGLKTFTDGIHERGGKVGVQLFHSGRYGFSKANGGRQPIAPSAVYSGYSREMPREMTIEEIKSVIEKGAAAAKRAKQAGFDMVEISASAGYLICQFLSPVTNLRTDEYGGSWENRTRFAREYVAAVREAVGADYPVGMRIAGHDLVPDSNTNEDAVRFAKEMEEAGIDCLNVTGGWHESKVPQITADLPRGGFDFLVSAIKDAVHIPVAASNRINDPTVAERLLALGVADMVSLGRPHIADPEWCNKAASGNADIIRRCLGCNQGCLAKAFFNEPITCLVNGEVGREYLIKDIKAAEKKQKILVIGGGAAGCEFAIRAAQRGHSVTLWEKESKLGGQLYMAAIPPHKQEFLSLLSYFENMLQKVGVEVVLNKTADLSAVKADEYDAVVTATGRGAMPEIALTNRDNTPVYTAYDILKQDVIAGKHVVVIGGGTVGCETAAYLAEEAAVSPAQVYHMMAHRYETAERVYHLIDTCRRDIALVDIRKIGIGFEAGTAWPMMKDFKRYGVKQFPFTSVLEVGGGEAVLEVKKPPKGAKNADGVTDTERVTVPCDTVILAVGAVPDNALYKELKSAGLNVYNIGDSHEVRNVLHGIREACDLSEMF